MPSSASTAAMRSQRRRRRRRQRQPVAGLREAHRFERRLDGDGVGLYEVHLHQRQQAFVRRARAAAKSPLSARSTNCAMAGRRLVRHDRDHAASAQRQQGERERVVPPASTEKSAGAARQISHSCPRSPDASFTPATLPAAATRSSVGGAMLQPVRLGYVVEDERAGDAVRDGAEVPVQAVLGRLVVVRRHRQQAVGAEAPPAPAPA